MPGRKETPVQHLFKYVDSTTFKGKRAVCKFCFTEVANNGTRKEKHILDCMNCTDDIKMKHLGNKINKIKSRKRKGDIEAKRPQQSVIDIVTLTDSDQSQDSQHHEEFPDTADIHEKEIQQHELHDPSDQEKGNSTKAASSKTGADSFLSATGTESSAKTNLAPIFFPGLKVTAARSTQSSSKSSITTTPRQPREQLSSKLQRSQANLCVDRMSSEQNVSNLSD